MRRKDRERDRAFAYDVIDRCEYGVAAMAGEAPVYVVHLSSAAGLAEVRKARAQRPQVVGAQVQRGQRVIRVQLGGASRQGKGALA